MSTPTTASKRHATRPKHAGCKADPCGVLDQQDIIDLVGVQIANSAQGDPLATCKTLASWSSVHRLPCSQHVFENACKRLGFWGAKARDKAIHWLTNHPEPSGLAELDYLAGAELDWKLVFDKLCRCVRKDRSEDGKSLGLLRRWANVLEARSLDAAPPSVAAGPAADPAHEIVLEMCDHAVHGYMDDSGGQFTMVARRWYEHLALSLVDPAYHFNSRNSQVSPLSKSLAMGTRVENALFRASSSSLIVPNELQDTLDTAFDSGVFTPNMRLHGTNLHGADWSHELLPPSITVDVAAWLWPSGMCRDTKLEGGAVPNVILNAVLSHPKYDPGKCLNRPSEQHLAFVWQPHQFGDGSITLAGLFLARYHERGSQDWELNPSPFHTSTTKSGKDATLRRILEHPLQNLRQRSNARSLVHMCLLGTITCAPDGGFPCDDAASSAIFRIADGLRAWIWRLEALRILWEKTCDAAGGRDGCIWRYVDNEGRTPRQLFELAWDIYYKQAQQLLQQHSQGNRGLRAGAPNKATALSILKHIGDIAYTPLNELFVVAERG